MRTLPIVLFLSFLALAPARSARADHEFTENFEEDGADLADAVDISQEIDLSGDADFTRENVGDMFSADPLLSVSSADPNPLDPEAEEKELLWATEDGDEETLALTPDDADGNYDGNVSMQAIFAATGALEHMAHAGVVARYSQGRFYIAYGVIGAVGGGFSIQLALQKKVAPGLLVFADLDEAPAFSALKPFVPGDNYRLYLEVTEASDDGLSNLCAHLDHVVLRGGEPTLERLASLSGRDGTIPQGRVGLYASSGTTDAAIQIAFDPAHAEPRESPTLPCLLPRLEGIIGGLDARPEAGDMTGLNEEVNLGWKITLETKVGEMMRFAEGDNPEALAENLGFVRARADGGPAPPDWVKGEAAAEIVQQVDLVLGVLASGQADLAAPAALEASLRPPSGQDLESDAATRAAQALRPTLRARSWPNPAAGDVTIEFTTARPGQVVLRIYDLQGRVVRTLMAGFLPAGAHALRWSEGASRSAGAPPGVYLYELNTGGERVVGRLVKIP